MGAFDGQKFQGLSELKASRVKIPIEGTEVGKHYDDFFVRGGYGATFHAAEPVIVLRNG